MTQIYCLQSPPIGGETLFLSTRSLWNQLTSHEQEQYRSMIVYYKKSRNKMSLDGCVCLPGTANVSHSPDIDMNSHKETIIMSQPLFRKIPETQFITMSVAPMYLSHIDNYTHEESSQIIANLIRKCNQTIYTHTYQMGDLVLFDNRQCLHSAVPNQQIDIENSSRLLHRIRLDSSKPMIPISETIIKNSIKKI